MSNQLLHSIDLDCTLAGRVIEVIILFGLHIGIGIYKNVYL